MQIKGKLRKVNTGGRGQFRKVFNCGFGWNVLSGWSLTGWVQSLRSQGGPFLGRLQCIRLVALVSVVAGSVGTGNPFVEVEAEVTTFGALRVCSPGIKGESLT